ncbi:hypothetical protein Glove_332g36 [Diversispora epigaea]|uniref:Uncharacterized protein n=1 Tax=Diversispora epigaea TaxID=1348612 RepID=A0A397HJ91_9GLOM|nr:hypothetical protein Glove_332g36 [Diversispora epigaea]
MVTHMILVIFAICWVCKALRGFDLLTNNPWLIISQNFEEYLANGFGIVKLKTGSPNGKRFEKKSRQNIISLMRSQRISMEHNTISTIKDVKIIGIHLLIASKLINSVIKTEVENTDNKLYDAIGYTGKISGDTYRRNFPEISKTGNLDLDK